MSVDFENYIMDLIDDPLTKELRNEDIMGRLPPKMLTIPEAIDDKETIRRALLKYNDMNMTTHHEDKNPTSLWFRGLAFERKDSYYVVRAGDLVSPKFSRLFSPKHIQYYMHDVETGVMYFADRIIGRESGMIDQDMTDLIDEVGMVGVSETYKHYTKTRRVDILQDEQEQEHRINKNERYMCNKKFLPIRNVFRKMPNYIDIAKCIEPYMYNGYGFENYSRDIRCVSLTNIVLLNEKLMKEKGKFADLLFNLAGLIEGLSYSRLVTTQFSNCSVDNVRWTHETKNNSLPYDSDMEHLFFEFTFNGENNIEKFVFGIPNFKGKEEQLMLLTAGYNITGMNGIYHQKSLEKFIHECKLRVKGEKYNPKLQYTTIEQEFLS